MEDHFDDGQHFRYVIVTSADGEHTVFTDISHREVYKDEWVVWVTQPSSQPMQPSKSDAQQLPTAYVRTRPFPSPWHHCTCVRCCVRVAVCRRWQHATRVAVIDPSTVEESDDVPTRRLQDAVTANFHAPNRILITRIGMRDENNNAVWPSCDEACISVSEGVAASLARAASPVV
jgi:hypothetical protein